jgi:branched-subunit amino acid transport protein
MSWWAIGVLAAGAYGAKVVGLVVGSRVPFLARMDRLLAVLPIAVLAAVAIVLTFDGGRRLTLDARAAGVAAGAIAAWRRAPFVVVVVTAACVAALIRL